VREGSVREGAGWWCDAEAARRRAEDRVGMSGARLDAHTEPLVDVPGSGRLPAGIATIHGKPFSPS